MTSVLDDSATLVDILRRRAERHPERPAFIFLADGETREIRVGYGELDRRARAVAACLQDRVAAGERALLIMPSGLEFIPAFLGCLYAGVVAVPAVPPPLNRPAPRLQVLATDAGAGAVITTARIRPALQRHFNEIPELTKLPWLDGEDLPRGTEARWRRPAITPESLAFLQYTSGSTADPKGVMVSHGNIVENETLLQSVWEHTEDSRLVNWMPLHHDGGLLGMVLQSVFVGGLCVLLSPTDFLQQPARWLRAISRFRAHTSAAPNIAYDLCAQRVTPRERESLDLRDWRVAVNSAEPVRAETLDRFTAAFEPCGFRRSAFHAVFGLAESTVFVTGGEWTGEPVVRHFDADALLRDRATAVGPEFSPAHALVGCGRPGPGHRVIIVHPETRRLCAPGEVGEIWVSGPSVALGYWNRPEETARIFRAVPEGDGEGPCLRTGDKGFIHEGELFVAGRWKDLIVIEGRNHYPQDIEETVAASHFALQPNSGAAFAVEAGGAERVAVVQEVRREGRQHIDLNAILQAIRLAVAREHGLRVQAVGLLPPLALPKTTSGKIRRQAARAAFLDGTLPTLAVWRREEREVKPADGTGRKIEAELADIFRTILGTDQVGPEDNFFEMGGDSLSFAHLCAQIEERLGFTIPPEAPLTEPTVRGFARLAGSPEVIGADPSPLPPVGNVIRHSPLESIRAIARSGELPFKRKKKMILRVIANFIGKTGPDFVDYVLPYRFGTAFLNLFCRIRWVQALFFPQQRHLVRECLSTMGNRADEAKVTRHSISCNWWCDWRLAALTDCPPEEFRRWVAIRGLETVRRSCEQGRGVILLHVHTVLAAVLALVMVRNGLEDCLWIGGLPYPLELMRLNHLKHKFLLDQAGMAMGLDLRIARQMVDARRVLARGGIVIMAGDGFVGRRGIVAPFLGRRRRFGPGFAELAAETGAPVVLSHASLQLDGRVEISFRDPIPAPHPPGPEQVETMIRAYISFFEEVWTRDLGNMFWDHLNRYLALPRERRPGVPS